MWSVAMSTGRSRMASRYGSCAWSCSFQFPYTRINSRTPGRAKASCNRASCSSVRVGGDGFPESADSFLAVDMSCFLVWERHRCTVRRCRGNPSTGSSSSKPSKDQGTVSISLILVADAQKTRGPDHDVVETTKEGLSSWTSSQPLPTPNANGPCPRRGPSGPRGAQAVVTPRGPLERSGAQSAPSEHPHLHQPHRGLVWASQAPDPPLAGTEDRGRGPPLRGPDSLRHGLKQPRKLTCTEDAQDGPPPISTRLKQYRREARRHLPGIAVGGTKVQLDPVARVALLVDIGVAVPALTGAACPEAGRRQHPRECCTVRFRAFGCEVRVPVAGLLIGHGLSPPIWDGVRLGVDSRAAPCRERFRTGPGGGTAAIAA